LEFIYIPYSLAKIRFFPSFLLTRLKYCDILFCIKPDETFRIVKKTESGGGSGESRQERVPKVQGVKALNLSGKRTEQMITLFIICIVSLFFEPPFI